jgi:hypothetical protein
MTELTPLQHLRGQRYRLLSCEGRVAGAMATRWRGLDLRDGVIRTLITMPVEYGGEDLVTFEGEAAQRVCGPNGAPPAAALLAVAAFIEGDHGVIVTDASVRTLRGVCLPVGVAARVVADLAGVVATAHAAGVVHRAIHPENAVLTADGTVRLAGWGMGWVYAGTRGHTRTADLLWAQAFLAPEQRRDARDVRPASDVYTLAALLVGLCTGAPPDPLEAPETLNAVALGPLTDAVRAAGRHHPQERPSADAFAAMLTPHADPPDEAAAWLRRVLAEPPPTLDPPTLDPDSASAPPTIDDAIEPPRRRFPRVGGWVGAVVAVSIAGTIGFTAGESHGEEAGRDPFDALPMCPDAAARWDDRSAPGPKETTSTTLADVDDDGQLDVMFANQYSETLTIWWGRADGPPVDRVEIPMGRAVFTPATGDFDEDGHTDLLIPLYDDGAFGLARGLGDRRFAEPVRQPVDPALIEVLAYDIDRDGHLDLVGKHAINADIGWFRGRGDGQFEPIRALYANQGDAASGTLAITAGGVELWTHQPTAAARAPLTSAGLIGRFKQQTLPRSIALNWNRGAATAAYPSGVVAMNYRRRSWWLMRIDAAAPPCRLARVDRRMVPHAVAVTDLNHDGVVDVIAAETCMYCRSAQHFLLGVR